MRGLVHGPHRPITTKCFGLLLLIAPVILTIACSDELRPGFCEVAADCPTGQRCELGADPNFHRCVATDVATVDSGVDRPDAGGGIDRPDAAGTTADAPGDIGGDAPAVACSPANASTSCLDPNRPFCQAGVCVGCQAPDAGLCAPPRPACDVSSGACVECVGHGQCTKPEQPLCSAHRCASCATAGGDLGCQMRDPGRPVCITSNGHCAECGAHAQCAAKPGKPFCVAEACVGCQAASPGACTGTTPVCSATSGACVECVADADCKQPTAPFCSGNKCVPCGTVPAGRCAAAKATLPACASTGACVECNTSADCTADPKRPICAAAEHTCRGCAADSECAARNGADPGICLDHLGGRCATESETIFVAKTATCSPTGGGKATPLCSPQDAPKLFAATKSIVLIRGSVSGFSWGLAGVPALTVIGQQAIVVGGLEAGLRLSGGGEVFARALTIRGSEGGGAVVSAGATLRLRDSLIDGNAGGGLLIDGGRFDIRGTVISNNGPASASATLWGGALILNVPGTPAHLERVSFKSNRVVGITCSSGTTITGAGVYAKDNGGADVSPTCGGVTTCETESPTCGGAGVP